MDTRVKIAAVAAAVTAITLIAVSARKAQAASPPSASQIPTSIMLSASAGSLIVGGSDTLTATLTDQNGSPIPNYTLTLLGAGTLAATTNSSGTATWSVQFKSTGSYQVYAKS